MATTVDDVAPGLEPEDAPESREDRARGALRGGAIMAGASVAMRAASLVAQLILGRLLLDEEVGLFAVALSLTAVATALRSTIRPVLVETLTAGRSFDAIYRWVMWSVLLLSAAAVAASPIIASGFGEADALMPLLPLMFLSIPLQVLPAFGLARVNQSENYARLASLLTLGIIARQGGIIIAALAGMGVMSFVVGTFAGAVFELTLVRGQSGRYPSLFKRTHRLDASGAKALRWLPLATLALVFATSGDYPTAAAITTVGVVGQYFFAYQLTGALSQPFHLAVNSVLVPTFAKLKDADEVRQGFLRTARTITLIAGVPFGFFAVTAAPLAHFAWSGRWDSASPAIMLFAVAMPLRLVHPACLSILQGRGLWRSHAAMMWLAGLTLVGTAALGALRGTALSIALYTLIGHAIVTLVTAVWIARLTSTSAVKSLLAILEPWVLAMVGVGVAHLVEPLDSVTWTAMFTHAGIYAAVTLPLIGARFRRDLTQLASSIR
jgi:O-antigen/teichoic acid export membrane protein